MRSVARQGKAGSASNTGLKINPATEKPCNTKRHDQPGRQGGLYLSSDFGSSLALNLKRHRQAGRQAGHEGGQWAVARLAERGETGGQVVQHGAAL